MCLRNLEELLQFTTNPFALEGESMSGLTSERVDIVVVMRDRFSTFPRVS